MSIRHNSVFSNNPRTKRAFLWCLLCAINFYRILNYFTKVFTLSILFFKKSKNLRHKCADDKPKAGILHHAICKIATSSSAVSKIANSYYAICKGALIHMHLLNQQHPIMQFAGQQLLIMQFVR